MFLQEWARAAFEWFVRPSSRPWVVIVATHLLGIPALYFLIAEFAWWMPFAIWFMWFLFGGIGVEMSEHRMWSHLTFKILGKLRYLLGWFYIMGIQDTTVFWTVLHRGLHHPKADRPEDLHSPVNGWWHSYMGWMFKPMNLETKVGVARDLLRDPMHRCIQKRFTEIYWISIGLAFLLLGPKLACILFVIPSLLSLHQESMVNLFCHIRIPYLTYRNFDTPDNSVNNLIMSYLVPWGLFLHNNHHARPGTYHFDHRWFEIDISKYVVPSLVWLDKRIG